MNIQKMMQQAQAMQSKMQEELEALKIEAASGGGMVTVEMSGTKEILSVRIDPACVDPKDVETLQDLVLAASREAARRVDEAVQKKTSSMLGGMMGDAGNAGRERFLPAFRARSSGWPRSCSGCRASAARARPGWPITFCASPAKRRRTPRPDDFRVAGGGPPLLGLQHADGGGPVRRLLGSRSGTPRSSASSRSPATSRRSRRRASSAAATTCSGAPSRPLKGIGPDEIDAAGLLRRVGPGRQGSDPGDEPQRRRGGDGPLHRPAPEGDGGPRDADRVRAARRRRHRVRRRSDDGALAREPPGPVKNRFGHVQF